MTALSPPEVIGFTAYTLTEVADAADRLAHPSCTLEESEKFEKLMVVVDRVLREAPKGFDPTNTYELAEGAARELAYRDLPAEAIRTDAILLDQ
jgi:hypothetical protein